jgi:hypothetical protein
MEMKNPESGFLKFISILFEIYAFKNEKLNNDKTDTELDDESVEMNVFDKSGDVKHKESVGKNDDDSMSIEDTNNLFHFEQTNSPDKYYIKNKKKNNYDEVAYPFSNIIFKVKHEPEAEADPENIMQTLL